MDTDVILENNSIDSQNSELKSEKKSNLFYLLTILYIYFIYGFFVNSFGVTLNTMKDIFKITSIQAGLCFTFQALGCCISSALLFYTLDKWNRQIQLSFYLLFLSTLILIYPFLTSPLIFFIINGLFGFTYIIVDCVVDVWIVEIKRENANTYLQILHFFFPFGSFFSSIFFGLFLNEEKNQKVENSKKQDLSVYFNYSQKQDDKFIIWIPYMFCSFLFFIAFLLMIISYKIQPHKETNKDSRNKKNNSNNTNDNEISNSNEDLEIKTELKSNSLSKKYYIFFVIIISVFITLVIGSEMNLARFLPSYLNESPLHISQQKSAFISSILTFSIFIGRFLCILISHKIPTEVYLYVNFVFLFTGNLILSLFSQTSLTLIYIGIALAGLGFSSTYPLAISFIDERLSMTSKIGSFKTFSCNVFFILSPIFISSLLQKFPIYFIYVNSLAIFIFISFFITLHVTETIRLKKKL